MSNLDSILRSRDITLPTKVCLVKAMVFPVVMYRCESWSVKKAEHQRIDAFELWCWRRLLRVPWTARRSNQSILKEMSPGCYWKDWYWSWSSNTLATWCQELAHLKRPWCWERLKAGERGQPRMRWLNGITDSMNMSLSKLWEFMCGQGGLACCSPWGHKKSDTTEQVNWCVKYKKFKNTLNTSNFWPQRNLTKVQKYLTQEL